MGRARRCPPNRPPRCTATSANARSASSCVFTGGARRYTGAPARGTDRRARWRSTTMSRRRSCATTSSSTGVWGPSPGSSASITPPSSGCWARSGRRERRRPRRPSKLDPYLAFITETLEHFPTLTAARVFDMVKARGYPGGPDHFRHRIAQLRPRRVREAYLRLRTLPGRAGSGLIPSSGLDLLCRVVGNAECPAQPTESRGYPSGFTRH